MSRQFRPSDLFTWFESRRTSIVSHLSDFIAIDTSTGREAAAIPFLEEYLSSVGFVVRREFFHPRLMQHPARSPHPLSESVHDRPNLRARWNRSPIRDRDITFNCHIDVVPASPSVKDAFVPKVVDGRLYGRGAADTKNNLIMLTEALTCIAQNDLELSRRVWLDMVVEEEIGGNGTLSTILHGVPSQEVVVLEPTSLRVFRGHRGCLTFWIKTTGHSGHMGCGSPRQSAIGAAMKVVTALQLLESEMLVEARQHADFMLWERPVQLNVGMIRGGEWPGSVSECCEITGNLGFLPPMSLDATGSAIRHRCEEALASDPDITLDVRFDRGLRNAAFIQPENQRLALDLGAAVSACGGEGRSAGWKVSCDAHLYDQVAKMPVVVFGSGSLEEAHSVNESVDIAEIQRGAAMLVKLLTTVD